MNSRARQALINGGHLFFHPTLCPNGRSDLLASSLTQDALLEHIAYLVAKGYHFEFTAVKTDHDNDSALGVHCHYNGFCADGWPLTGPTPGAWLPATDPFFARFLIDVSRSPNLHQIGLGGSAYDDVNMAAAGPTAFEDGPEDHVHLGSQ
jgi:hypothetical protein